ncbi:MAG: MBL fold metallo-hydrolase, partial [Ruminococcaceae bacterium]|nr:MBL fold metallo-hydrolase [Oscillospiraceae bacterium]
GVTLDPNTNGLYAGQKSYIYINKNATLQNFDDYCAALHVAGFKYYTNNQIGDNQFATYVTNTQIINVMYFKATAEVRITTDVRGTGTNAFDLPKLSGEITTPTPTHSFALTMVEIDNTGYPGGMCFIYRLRNGEFFIVDSGINASGSHTSSAQWIYKTLKKLAGNDKIVVAGWLITHVHSDHLGGLYDMSKDSTITNNMTIKQLIHNEPTDDVTKELDGLTDSSANKIWAWMNPIISAFNIKSVIKAHPGQVIRYPGIDITVLASQDVVLDQKASMEDSNDISVITQVSFSGKKILMLGDALKIENAFLAKVYGSNLKSDILQVTHHGYNLTGADPVNKLCAPEIALWSIGQGSDGRDRFEMNLNWSMNTYLKNNVTNYSAKDGNLTFYIYSNTDWRVKQPSPSW